MARLFKAGLSWPVVSAMSLDMKTWEADSLLFFLPTVWWLDALKRREKIIQENAFGQLQKKKKPELKFNPGLALIGLRTTGPITITKFVIFFKAFF